MSSTLSIIGDRDLARHLLILRHREMELRNDGDRKRETTAHKLAAARYQEARVIAAILHKGPTEYAVWEAVQAGAVEADTKASAGLLPPSRGRLGAEINAAWLDYATDAIVCLWHG